MASIQFMSADDRIFHPVSHQVEIGRMTQEVYESLPEGERSSRTCIHHEGDEESPQLLEIKVPADTEVQTHAHSNDEIIVVLDGELHFGNKVCRAGASVFIPKLTLYSFRTGSDGCRILNFRPKGEYGYISKEELLASKHGAA